MAGADYKSCDVCGCKTFYDAELHYDFEEHNKETGLWNTGAHKSLCEKCAKTHELVVKEKDITKDPAHD